MFRAAVDKNPPIRSPGTTWRSRCARGASTPPRSTPTSTTSSSSPATPTRTTASGGRCSTWVAPPTRGAPSRPTCRWRSARASSAGSNQAETQLRTADGSSEVARGADRRLERQLQRERRAVPRLAVDGQRAAVRGRDLPPDVEAETQPPTRFAVVSRSNAWKMRSDRRGISPRPSSLTSTRTRPPAACAESAMGLPPPYLIAFESRFVTTCSMRLRSQRPTIGCRNRHLDGRTGLRGLLAQPARHVAHQLEELDRLEVQHQPPRGQPRDVEQIVDQADQPVGGRARGDEGPRQLLLCPSAAAPAAAGAHRRPQPQLERGQRRLQLVRRDRDELVASADRGAALGQRRRQRQHADRGDRHVARRPSAAARAAVRAAK